MQIVSAVAIYFIIWWVLFFAVLTIGNREPEPDDRIVAGADRGAPARHLLGRKVLITSLGAAVLFGALYALLNSGISLQDIPLPAPPGT